MYTAAAWAAGQRAGGRGLVSAWAAGVLLTAAFAAVRLHQRQAAIGWRPEQQRDAAYFAGAAVFMAVCFGATTLVVRRRLRRGETQLGVGGVVAGAAASLGGFFANLVAFAFTDLAHLLSHR